jgi:hypothetical protein
MNDIPREVEVAVREAASAAGGYAGGLDGVYRRARRNRRRRLTAVSAGVAAALAAAGLGVVTHPLSDRATPPAQELPAGAPAQRLMLNGAAGVFVVASGLTIDLSGTTRVGELPPGGEIEPHWVSGADGWDRFAGLGDGRIVALGPENQLPGKPRADGVGIEGLRINLVVTAPDGTVQVKRDVRRKGEEVSLLTADTTNAYLWRPAGLVAHDLGSGAERVLVPRAVLRDGEIGAADLVGDRLVVSRAAAPCTLAKFDTRSGTAAGKITIPTLACTGVTGLRLSPDGQRLAVMYRKGDPAQGERVTVLSTADGTIMIDQWAASIGTTVPLVDLAWQDDHTLRGVVVPTGPGEQMLTPILITVD